MTESSGKGRQSPTPSSSALQPRQSISGQIADRLREEILSAAIGPDQPLKQDHVARRFDVSQAPVREALKRLASERLVVSQLNRGVRSEDALGFMWRHSGHAQVSVSEHRELLDCLRRGKGREAGELLRKHIEASTVAIQEALRRSGR